MEGLANRVATSHMLQGQNIATSAHYGGISLQQTPADKLPPPSYDEAQITVQAVDLQQLSNMEAEKQAIYRHPLLPLLAKLFEKCEQSTQTCECTPATAFDNEIKNGILQMNREGKPFYTEDRDLDNLVRISRSLLFTSLDSNLKGFRLLRRVDRNFDKSQSNQDLFWVTDDIEDLRYLPVNLLMD